ncbi:Xylosyltransferase 1-like [Homarus americanus]|uniref:protein xylosyltransferase n=1 Tax=Homarus americanus TaxID=6706 RepID=A0A8J5JGQ0_HOMAM|nr:Xylosyltransferase 1-like [Homarus americanus]
MIETIVCPQERQNVPQESAWLPQVCPSRVGAFQSCPSDNYPESRPLQSGAPEGSVAAWVAVTVAAVDAVVNGVLLETVGGEEIEGRVIPPAWEHLYHQDVEGDLVVREYLLLEVHPRTALLCPQGLAIVKLRMLIKTGQDIIEANPEAALDVPYAHWLVKPDDGVVSDEVKGSSKCPTLQECLGYQACLFNFGIEFCHMDPVPGQRKNLEVVLTCMREGSLLAAMRDVKYDQEYIQQIERRTHLVVHLTYTSRLEEGVKDYSLTEIWRREEAEEEVFHGSCQRLEDATEAGYSGYCHHQPPDPVDVSEVLWSLLGRVPSKECREEVRQIYCSFLYHNKGLCLPPFVVDPGQMQLLGLVYRPQHQYVIHVDARQGETRAALTSLLTKLMPGATNVRILPLSRSFVASWGSFNIVRAELESFEELLRMGVWDFGVKLSGADLPLRDVDDLSATLAAYRGFNFVPLFGQRNNDMNADQGLVLDVWHGCEGYVYNVTRGGGQPYPEEIPIYTGSQWAIMSRELVEYVVTPSLRSDRVNRWHYHLQTSIIPDESYFPTLTMNSPYHLPTIFQHPFNALPLSPKGPGPIEEEDLKEMLESSHRYFFARKFHTHTTAHPIRIMVAEQVRTNYYLNLKKYLPRALLHQLALLAFPHLKQQLANHPSLAHLTVTPGDLITFKVLPRLHLVNPCCSLPFDRSFKSTQEFVFWLDFTINDEGGSPVGGARALVSQRPIILSDGSKSALTTNVPLPYAMPGADTVYVELWFHVGQRSISQDCRSRIRPPGTPMEFPNMEMEEVTADDLHVVVQLIDPQGNVRCEERKTDHWDKSHVHPNRDFERVEMPSFFTLSCGVMETGPWTLLLPGPHDLPLDPRQQEQVDLLQGLWTVEQVMLLPATDYYGDLPKLPKRETAPPLHHPHNTNKENVNIADDLRPREEEEKKEKQKMNVKEGWERDEDEDKAHIKDIFYLSRQRRSAAEMIQLGLHHFDPTLRTTPASPAMTPAVAVYSASFLSPPYKSVREWFACGGGLLTTLLMLVFTYHWVVLPGLFSVRVSRRMKRSALLVFVAILVQILSFWQKLTFDMLIRPQLY